MIKEEADEIIEALEKLRQDIRDFKAGFEKENAEFKKQLAVAREIIENLLPFEHVIDPYALTSDIEENKRRFHEPFRKAEQFLEEIKEK